VAPDRSERVALFRYAVIAECVNPRLSAAERGWLVRELARQTHETPEGQTLTISRGTLDRWIRAYRERGLDGLRPSRRSDWGEVRRNPELLAEAARLRIELPGRSAEQISDIIFRARGVRVSPRTIRSHLARKGLDRAALAAEPRVYGRYEAERPNERWIGDVLVGPYVPHPRVAGSRQAKLFLIVDDHSRLLVHGQWGTEENTRAGQECLRRAVLRRGVPESFYVDRGAPFVHAALGRMCAVLGVRLLHSLPYSPQGRGKQERLNRLIRERFLLEATHVGIESIAELNERFMAFAEEVVNTRVHAETKARPIDRFLSGGPPPPVDPMLLTEAFRWSVMRTVTKTAAVSFLGNRYQVDPALCGRKVELRYDPEDLSRLDVYVEGEPHGHALPYRITRHVHTSVPQAERPEPEATGIDYLGLVLSDHDESTVGRIAFRDVPLFDPDIDQRLSHADDGEGDDGDAMAEMSR